jgi:N-ethylmaleimide reductase
MKDSNPEDLFTFVAESLSKLGVGYIHVVEPVDPRGDPNSRLFDPKVLRDAFTGPYLANGGYNKSRAEQALRTDAADFVVFSRPFIANPDLPRRLSVGAPLADPDPATFYGGGLRGYSDYPVWSSAG